MRKSYWYLASAAALMLAALALAQTRTNFVINGKANQLETLDKSGKTYVEVSSFAKAFGASVKYDAAKKTYTITSSATTGTTSAAAAGTSQLAGDQGTLGKIYTIGKDSPLYFTLKSAEYSVTRQTLQNIIIPKANEKLLILRFSVQNPQKVDTSISYGRFKITAVDNKDRNYEFNSYLSRDGETRELSVDLKPAQRVDVYMVQPVPAEVSIPKLIVQSNEGNAPVVRYDLRGKIKGLAAPFGDPKDATGSIALENVPGKLGTLYPMGYFDASFEGAKFSSEAMDNQAPEAGKRYLIATWRIKNASLEERSYDYGNFKFTLTDAEDSSQDFNGYLIRTTRDDHLSGNLKPGAEASFRVYFALSNEVAAKELSIRENDSRSYVFDVSSVK